MEDFVIRQVRIFISPTEGADCFDTLLGRVIRPVVTEFDGSLSWFWFSRYEITIGHKWEERNDCDFGQIPDSFKAPFVGEKAPGHRSLRFRFAVAVETLQPLESRLWQLIGMNGYAASDVRHYDQVGDTGSARFLGVERRGMGWQENRSALVTQVYHAAARLVLNGLVGPTRQGRYRPEYNDFASNPSGRTYDSVLHVVENIMDAFPPQPKTKKSK